MQTLCSMQHRKCTLVRDQLAFNIEFVTSNHILIPSTMKVNNAQLQYRLQIMCDSNISKSQSYQNIS